MTSQRSSAASCGKIPYFITILLQIRGFELFYTGIYWEGFVIHGALIGFIGIVLYCRIKTAAGLS